MTLSSYYNKITECKQYILNINIPNNQQECIKHFKFIYEKFTIDEWLDTNISFELANFIMEKRPNLLSLAIRMNVQINLFLRTINKFSNNPNEIFNKIGYSLGCFALTEKNTGVLSGLFLDTIFEENDDEYIINTNDIYKNWISQGFYSDYCILFSKNIQNEKDVRIFLIDMNNENIKKSKIDNLLVTKSLDLAKLEFNNVSIGKNCLLEKSKGEKKIKLLNGIFYGRYMIAEATISSILGLINHINNNIKDEEKFKKLKYDEYLKNCKREFIKYSNLLKINRTFLLKSSNVKIINCYKIYIIEKSIEVYNKLHLMFGTRALIYNLTYENLIFNKVAEGDTTVLRVSLVVNHLRCGLLNMINNAGLSYKQIINLYFMDKEQQFDFIMDNLYQISNNIISSNIDLLNI